MGIEKPYVVERGALEGAPGRPDPIDVEARLEQLVRPGPAGVCVAGVEVPAPPALGRNAAVHALRDVLGRRLRERRPHADASTWARFETLARAAAERADVADRELRRTLILAIDGL
mgnify:FL=1